MDLPSKKYDVIYIDPPWKVSYFRKGNDKGKLFENEKYKTMTSEEIMAIDIPSNSWISGARATFNANTTANV